MKLCEIQSSNISTTIDLLPSQSSLTISSFPPTTLIHSGYFYSASSSPLLLRGATAPDAAWILCRNFTTKSHRQLWVKDLPRSLCGARAGVEPMNLRTKGVDSTHAATHAPHTCLTCSLLFTFEIIPLCISCECLYSITVLRPTLEYPVDLLWPAARYFGNTTSRQLCVTRSSAILKPYWGYRMDCSICMYPIWCGHPHGA